MSDNVAINEGVPAHLEACVAAVRDSELGRTYFRDEARLYGFIREGLVKGEIRVASSGADPCLGFVWFTGNGMFYRYPYIRLLAVSSAKRSDGISSRLLAHVEGLLRQREHPKVFLTVAAFNKDAKRLYERIGYQEVALVPDLFQPGYAEHVMMKPLYQGEGRG